MYGSPNPFSRYQVIHTGKLSLETLSVNNMIDKDNTVESTHVGVYAKWNLLSFVVIRGSLFANSGYFAGNFAFPLQRLVRKLKNHI
jgi:hypothetical protein